MGTLRLDQGARDHGSATRRDPARARGAAVRVPQVPGLRHARRHARPARRGAPRRRAARACRRRQARPGRHPRNRVRGAGAATDSRRQGCRADGAANAPDSRFAVQKKSSSSRSEKRPVSCLCLPAQCGASPAVSRRRAAPRPAAGRRRSRAPREHVGVRLLGRLRARAAAGAHLGVAPFRGGIRRADGRGRALAAAPAARCAARQPALCPAASGLEAAPGPADSGAGTGRRRHARRRIDTGARRRPGGGDRQPRRLSRAAGGKSARIGARGAHARRLELGRRVRDAPSPAARRAARRPPAARAVRRRVVRRDARGRPGALCRRHRTLRRTWRAC